jgi:hypothetical protein
VKTCVGLIPRRASARRALFAPAQGQRLPSTTQALRNQSPIGGLIARITPDAHAMKLLPPMAVFILAHLLVIGGAIMVASQSERSVLLANTGGTIAGGRP